MTGTFRFCLIPRSRGSFLLRILFIRHFSRFYIRSMRMLAVWAQSRDLSTDKQNKIYWALINSTWSDKSHFKKNLDQKSGNVAGIANLDLLAISWPSYSFLWKTNLFSTPFLYEIIKNLIETHFRWTNFKWCWFCVFWVVSLICKYVTSYLWLRLL